MNISIARKDFSYNNNIYSNYKKFSKLFNSKIIFYIVTTLNT